MLSPAHVHRFKISTVVYPIHMSCLPIGGPLGSLPPGWPHWSCWGDGFYHSPKLFSFFTCSYVVSLHSTGISTRPGILSTLFTMVSFVSSVWYPEAGLVHSSCSINTAWMNYCPSSLHYNCNDNKHQFRRGSFCSWIVESCSAKRYTQVLIPGTCECDLIWK